MNNNDPIGNAIWEYHSGENYDTISVTSTTMDDDILPIAYLFRSYSEFPHLEKVAMLHCSGEILDVGAGAGPHTDYLIEQGFSVSTIETSYGAYKYLKEKHKKANHFYGDVQLFNEKKFDTLLLLMNGIGIAGSFSNCYSFLTKMHHLLNPKGKIICESTDLNYLYDKDSYMELKKRNINYFGDVLFNMQYKNCESGWFPWVYLDLENMITFAKKVGFSCQLLAKDNYSFLIQLTKET